MIRKRCNVFSLLAIAVFCAVFLTGCDRKKENLIVLAGKGLHIPMEEIKTAFENEYKNIQVNIIYGGSETLLETVQKTRTGDVYIPGSGSHIHDAGELVLSSRIVARHKAVFGVRKDNPLHIRTLEDLLRPEVKIAIGNKEMCAIGKVSEEIFDASPRRNAFLQNIAISATTVNELLALVLNREVDASLIWSEMRLWPEAKDLLMIEIPSEINRFEEILVAVLTTARNRNSADLFADFVAREGQSIFKQHGFGE